MQIFYDVSVTSDIDTAASELGIVSSILHKYGNDDLNYPSAEFKHDLGIIRVE